ncbi:BED-type domain-containing protein [Citrus sinensis]|uniref:BED-type domain-containing protein n=1 Tax=Citrus sinensis TaxID=2711 RepID=A0ACB8N1Q2_CITSI|nr:BED-type domain-containing protein [Citrus sinensis]
MIIMGELSLSFVDNKGFRHFCIAAILQFVMPSRRTIVRDVMDLLLEEKTMLKSLICNNKQRVSLTTDLWTSVQNMSYMVITAYFIDSDWCLNRRIISFSVIEDHRGKKIGKKIVACLQDWGIERLFAIIIDNATTNGVAFNYVTMQLLAWRNDDALVLAGQYMHVRCYAHILNLIVVSGLNELHASVAAIRNVVKYVRSSTTRLHAFKQCAQQVKCPNGTVILDCPTSFDPRVKMDFAKHIFEIIFANGGWNVEEMTKAVKDLLNELYDAYSAMCSGSTPSMCSESVPSCSYGGTSYSPYFTTEVGLAEVPGGDGDDIFRVSRPFLGYAQKVFVQNEGKRVVSKVERYLSDPIEDPRNLKLNVLLWWKVNGSKYPILEKIERDFLDVPVSIVASEFAFSTGRRVIDEYWSSLTPCMIQEDIKEQIFHMELQEDNIFLILYKVKMSQASTVEIVSTDMGVMDI